MLRYCDELSAAMKQVPPLRGEEALYNWIGSVLDAAARDPDIKRTLKETAVEAERVMITRLFQWRYNGRPAGNGWNSPLNNAEGVPTISTELVPPKQTCSTTGRRKRSTSIPRATAKAGRSKAGMPIRSLSSRVRRLRSAVSGLCDVFTASDPERTEGLT